MPHALDLLNLVDDEPDLERLRRVDLLCLRDSSSRRLALPEGDSVFLLRGVFGRAKVRDLHMFEDGFEDAGEILMALVSDGGAALLYRDTAHEEQFEDLATFAAWLAQRTKDDAHPQLSPLLDSVLDAT